MTDVHDPGSPVDEPGSVALERPRSLMVMLGATCVWAVLLLVGALSLFGYRSFLHRTLIDANNRASKPKANYVGHVVDQDVTNLLTSGLIIGALTAFIVVLLAVLAIRTKTLARWILVVLATGIPALLCGLPQAGALFHFVAAFQDVPGPYRVIEVLAGLCALLVLVQMFVRPTREWFAAVAPPRAGGLFGRGGAGGGGATPGLGQSVGGLGMLFGRRSAAPGSDNQGDSVSDGSSDSAGDETEAVGSDASEVAPPAASAKRGKQRPGGQPPQRPGGSGRSKSRRA